MTIRQVVKVAEAIGLDADAMTFELEGLNELSLPAVLHWRGTHFVVLTKVTADGVVLLDPTWGRKHYKIAELRERLTGVAIEMRPTDRLIVGSIGQRRNAFQPIIDELKAMKGELVKLCLTAFYLESLVIVVPLLIARILNAFAGASTAPAGTIVVWVLLLGTLASGVLRQYRSLALTYLSAKVRARFISKLIPRLLNKSFDFFRQRSVGDLQYSLLGAEWLRNTITVEFVGVVADGLLAIGILLAMAFLNPPVALITFIAVGLIASIVLVTARKDVARFDDIMQSRLAESVFVFETLRAAKTIKLFGQEQKYAALWGRRVHRTVAQEVQHSRSAILSDAVPTAASELIVVGTIVAQVLLLPGFGVTIGTIFALYVYQRLVLDRCRAIAFRVAQFNISRMCITRMTDIMDEAEVGEPSLAGEARSGGEWPERGTVLEVKGVSFRFQAERAAILQDVSFSVEAGCLLGLCGRSGVGKTTLLEILLGIRTADAGDVRWGGVPIRELDQQAFRRSVVPVTQDDLVLAGTIEENITLFDEAPDFDRIWDAARTAKLERDILEMPLQYSTMAGESGCALSGGQRQRLLLARALYAQPRVLIIDEGTSEIDPATEAEIYVGLQRRGITLIVVAHRTETLGLAHRTLMLEGGRVFEKDPSTAAQSMPGAGCDPCLERPFLMS